MDGAAITRHTRASRRTRTTSVGTTRRRRYAFESTRARDATRAIARASDVEGAVKTLES
jgi:rRNA processing protein Krr1/Pno1